MDATASTRSPSTWYFSSQNSALEIKKFDPSLRTVHKHKTYFGLLEKLITDYENGILIPPNDPKELENSVNMLLENDEIANKISEKGYEFVMKNLTWEILLPKYVKFYEDLVNS